MFAEECAEVYVVDARASSDSNRGMPADAVVDALDRVVRFRGDDLARAVGRLEGLVAGKDRGALGSFLGQELVTMELLRAAVMVKRAASQIDNIVHAVGMLVCLPELLRPGERVEAVSLAAGNTGKPFDLVTDQRIAEFTFIDWKGGAESIRKQKVFKDFYQLAEAVTTKERCLYFLGDKHAPKVFTSTTSCKDMLQKYAPLRDGFLQRYEPRMSVREYYTAKQGLVQLKPLEEVAPKAAAAFASAMYAEA
jgi:hypothetical protein